MSISKVASEYRQILRFASQLAYDNIKQVYTAAKALTQPNIANLWLNAAGTYGEDQVQSALNQISNTASIYYDAAMNKGVSGNEQATFLTKLDQGLSSLRSVQIMNSLDPMASDKVSDLSKALENAHNYHTGAYLPPMNKSQSPSSAGNSYSTEDPLQSNMSPEDSLSKYPDEDPNKLNDVVQNLNKQNYNPWDPEAQS